MSKLKQQGSYFRFLVGSGLVGLSLCQLALPVLAAGTTAGGTISNKATATYDDDDPNTPSLTTESNTVTVTVAKVAGITNVPAGFNNLGTLPGGTGAGSTILTGHTVEFLFNITNTGNDVSNIFIPSSANLTTTGLNTGTLVVTVDTNGDGTFEAYPVNGIIPNVAANGTIKVKVTGVVTATSAGAPLSVRLGDTGSNTAPNTPAADTQNQPDSGTAPDALAAANEVRTETGNNPVVAGLPANGQREASSINQVFLGSNPKAMVILKKTNAGITDNGANPTSQTPNNLNDDYITYNLNLQVSGTSPNALFTPGALDGRNLPNVTGVPNNTNLILVSDVIPTGTALVGTPTAPNANWTVVYTASPLTTTADAAVWNTTNPGNPTRIGWVYNANSTGSGLITPGSAVITGFQFKVVTSGIPVGGGTVANIAQAFGTTDPDGTPDSNPTDGTPVFDESGDSNPANLNDNGTDGPPENDPTSTGVPNPGTHGTDTGNNNSATGSPGGEDNVVTLVPPGTILNGPANQPAAVGDVFQPGTTDNNHDFQNKAVAPTVADPGTIVFTNTLSNPDPTNALTNVLLQPIQPSAIAGGNNGDIPIGTTVKIDFGNQTATYTYTGSQFNITAGTPIIIPSLAPGVVTSYTVTVDLPNGTPISTDPDANNATLLTGGFPIPIVAYKDSDSDGTPFVGVTPETVANYTVDQIYKGYLKLTKQVRVLDSTGTLRTGMSFTDPDVNKKAQPGDILDYRVIYRNISESQSGSGTNVILNANNVVITENGTLNAPNNWARDNDSNGSIDTLNVQNSASDTSVGSTITFLIGNPATANGTIDTGVNVTGYLDTIPTVAPAGIETVANLQAVNSGDFVFGFKRTVNTAP